MRRKKRRTPYSGTPDEGDQREYLRRQIALERFALISPLRHPGLSRKQRREQCRGIAQKGWVHPVSGDKSLCERTVWNWYKSYEKSHLSGLRPRQRSDFGKLKAFSREILDKAVDLKDELPSRKVERCIEILELRQAIEPGSVKRSTLQKHLHALGKTGRKIKSNQDTVGRYCAEKPGDVWHSDEKHGAYIYLDGKYVQTNIFGIIDDCSRNCCGVEAFLKGTEPNLESMFRDALLIWRCPLVFYSDNGKVYTANQFTRICAELGISLLHTPVYTPEANGKQERFWNTLSGFIHEANNARYTSLSSLNQGLRAYIDIKYNRVIHSSHGRTPLSVYMEGLSSIRRVSPETIELAFRHCAYRKVVKDGTFGFDGRTFEVDAALAGQKIELRYNPEDTTDIIVYHGNERVQRARLFNPPAHLPKREKESTKPRKAGLKSSRQFLDSIVQQKQQQKQKLISPETSSKTFTLGMLLTLLDLSEDALSREDRQNILGVFDTFGPFEPTQSEQIIKNGITAKGKRRHISFYLRLLAESKLNKSSQ